MGITPLMVLLMLQAPPDSIKTLQTVTITSQSERAVSESQNSSEVSAEYIERHLAASLSQSLEGVAGVKAASIGSSLSRPTIRGLGFNRMVVSENGIKHESQQWGDDHGLEIDQFAIDKVEVLKGPSALLYGSDAVGGVLDITSNAMPHHPFEASVALFGRSNNESLGLSARVGGRRGGFFYRANVTLCDYADYRVPTDSIQYYSYWIRLKDGRLRNTAGDELDGRLTLGYTNNENFRTDLTVSDVNSRSGFFANAHGMEVRLSNIDYDRSRRDIDLPYQWVNHLKVQSHTLWQAGDIGITADVAWQHNLREEMSEPVAHGYMPRPADSLERRFDKHTLGANLGISMPLGQRHTLRAGVQGEYQHNRRGGWGFIIPDFDMLTSGAYVTDQWEPSTSLTLNGGLRYDIGRLDIGAYSDWFATPDANGTPTMRQRSRATSRSFDNLCFSLGANWHGDTWVVKANAGKAFRMPIAKELGANGINYHIFRYEQGNPDLDPEESYQLDLGLVRYLLRDNRLLVELDPYVNYFPNYIYLNPTAEYEEGLQLYRYTQTEALRMGAELRMVWRASLHWESEIRGAICHATQLSGQKRGYTLPFATPPSADIDAHYLFGNDGMVCLNLHLVVAQNDIVPPEKPTPGYCTLNLGISHQFKLRHGDLCANLQINNLLNTKYYDHTSYYRLIDVPEPGRNISININYKIKKQEKQ